MAAPALRDASREPGGCPAGCHGFYLEPPPGGALTVPQVLDACEMIHRRVPQYRQHIHLYSPAPAGGQHGQRAGPWDYVPGSQLAGSRPPPPGEYARAQICLFAPPAPYAREDNWHLARYRRLPHTGPALWKMLTSGGLPPPATPEAASLEAAYVSRVQARRARFVAAFTAANKCATIPELKLRLAEEGIPCSAGMTMGGMYDALEWAAENGGGRLPGLSNLDAPQTAAVQIGLALLGSRAGGQRPAGAAAPRGLLISAGPGAGKTTTVTNFLAQAAGSFPTARVIVLAFNVEAESILRRRLSRLGVHIIPKAKVMEVENKGIAILTFDKLAYQIRQAKAPRMSIADLLGGAAPAPPAELLKQATSYRDGKEQAAAILQDGGADIWDLVVVDEAQDVTQLEANLVEGLLAVGGGRPALIAAGDPRQEVYSGATWYSARYSAAATAPAGCADTLHVLHNNYRSAPEIVSALNAYSKAAFPTLHHDQVAIRPSRGDKVPPVRIIEVAWQGDVVSTNQAIGATVGGLLAGRPAGESYGLAPVTLEKFRVGEATAAARQAIHEYRPADYTLALVGDCKIPEGDVFLLATARRIKGTEKPLVVVYGADRDYDVTVEKAAMAKLLYVALSRARDELVLVTQKLDRQRVKDLVAPFIAANLAAGGAGVVTAAAPARAIAKALTPVPIVGETLAASGSDQGVASISYGRRTPWKVTAVQLPALPAGGFDLGAGADGGAAQLSQADFVGHLAEAHLAQGLQAAWAAATGRQPEHPALASPHQLQIIVDAQKINHGLYTRVVAGGRQEHILCTSDATRDQLEVLLEDARRGGDRDCAPYFHAMLKYTALCGRPWTVSLGMAGAAQGASLAKGARAAGDALFSVVSAVSSAAVPEPLFWARDAVPMTPCRPGSLAGDPFPSRAVVSYETDALFGAVPVEFKYTAELTEAHERQLYSYMVLRRSARGVLFNGRTGECRILVTGPVPSPAFIAGAADFMCHARALLAYRAARSAALQHLAEYTIAPPPELSGSHGQGMRFTTAIAVDTEQDEQGLLTEIGAVAVSLTDWTILGTYQARAPSMAPVAPAARPRGAKGHIEQLVGLRRAPGLAAGTAAAEAAALRADFLAWCGEMSVVPAVYLHWAGSEKALLGAAACTVDVYSACFVPWLELKAGGGAGDRCRRGGTSLSAAVAQLLPELPFVAHQAFEDALATLAVVLATVNFGGKV